MSVIVDENTRVIVQGITGHQGSFHTGEMLKFGTKVVAGVAPGKGGQKFMDRVPIVNSVQDSLQYEPNATMIAVPAPYVRDAAMEAIDAGLRVIYILTEHVPFHDTMEIVHQAKLRGATVLGPNGPGITAVGKCKIGIMPNQIFRKGNVAVASRSGTLTYEIVDAITRSGMGESTVIGLGGDPVVGLTFIDVLEMFNRDPETEKIVLVGEIGGSNEERAAEYIKKNVKKQVVAYIAGRSAPPGKRMGHAGAIIEKGVGTAESKIRAFNEAGVKVAEYPVDVPKLLR
ncbi:succinyl-CoA synthetase subunit alpha [Thermogymnomonas acidicola]|uniref:Succinate--CoA ligase [ADP-forming] subunit alpha n=1 Tax=Thermogymnomonas acidicola TaxID=399579 RepID=A0AA37BSA4_9ARCH|nr:succinate--CoA ligase subunit alpha [Thermogymnomonas acidicola]GGM77755.1 succinyl-CoA synthetase subunit alpha [Thermogymnomonas acidicola]